MNKDRPRHRGRRFMAVLLGAVMLASCGGTDSADPDEGDDASAAPEASAGAPEASEPSSMEMEAGGGEGEDVELEFWTFVDNHAQFLMDRAEEFNAENDDVNVVINASVAEFEAHHDRLLIALQSGQGAPDIVDIEISNFGTFTRGNIQLHDLSDVIEPHREDLIEERLAPYMVDGTPYGVDYHLGSFVMYYNKDILDEAGVDADEIETWEDYVEAGKQVVENTDAWMTTVETQDRWSVIGPMLQNGGGTYNADGELILDSPENAEAVEMVGSLVNEHEIATTPPGGNHHDAGYFEAMNAGEYASVWMPQWYMIRFKDQMPDTEGKILVRPMPAFEPGGAVSTMGGGTGTAITLQAEEDKVDVAKRFLEYAKLTYDSNVKIWTELGFDPLRSDVYDDPALSEPDPWFNDEPVMSQLQEMFDNLEPEFTGPRYPEAVQELNENVAFNVVVEGADPAAEMAAAAERVGTE